MNERILACDQLLPGVTSCDQVLPGLRKSYGHFDLFWSIVCSLDKRYGQKRVARCDQDVARCDQLVARGAKNIYRSDQVLQEVTSCLPVVTSSCFLYCKIPKHVFGHISCLEAGPLTKTGQNDHNVEPVHHVKFGGDSWPYKIVTAPNVPD